MSNKIRKTKAHKKRNVMTGAFSARLQQRWPNRRSWHANPMRIGRRKLIMIGMNSNSIRK